MHQVKIITKLYILRFQRIALVTHSSELAPHPQSQYPTVETSPTTSATDAVGEVKKCSCLGKSIQR
ncbi:hypothetical protein LC607_34985 [Nostoc sp. CHAB 5824]|nr:hypothetical protein [Nostoc sp. CHAB 5824]